MNTDKLKQMLHKRRELVASNNFDMSEVISLGKNLDLTPAEVFFLTRHMDHVNPYEYDNLTVAEFRETMAIRRKINDNITFSFSEEPSGPIELWDITGLPLMKWFDLAWKLKGRFPFVIMDYTQIRSIDEIAADTNYQSIIEKNWEYINSPFYKKVFKLFHVI